MEVDENMDTKTGKRRSAQRPRHSLRLHVYLCVRVFTRTYTHVHTHVAPDTGAEAQRQTLLAACLKYCDCIY